MAGEWALDVLCIGELNPDRILSGIEADAPRLGVEQAFAGEVTVLGSSTAIACVLMQRLGLRTGLASLVGDDEAGRFCRDVLEREGVCTEAVIVDPAQATGVTYSLTYPGDRLLLTRPGTIGTFAATHVDPALVGRARHVHSGSFSLLAALRPGLPGLFAAARAAGATTSLDFGWDMSGRWEREALAAVLPHCDMVFPNRDEVLAMTGAKDVEAGAAALRAMGAAEVVVKLGRDGAISVGAHGTHAHAGYPAATVIDTTGAGDAFNAGFVRARLAGLGPIDRLRLGNACGALTVGAVGGTGGLQGPDAALELIADRGERPPVL